ncbi:glycosyltransferase family 8 protein [Streptococcus azizii]|uniref:Glycosyl hydrolase family 8 n=3 Tax=Streptococcus TaxID=1301 RepID=A0AB36JMM6_9STRE|nr:glycosyltransferase family 8 protein [Streptococcus azizii]ONK27675.1 glycosyl hydrolase family 8 [Streptococcus azizii]
MSNDFLRAVVLAGDYGYIRQIETTLKSLTYHNKNLKIYIFNQDIPKEWFVYYKQFLNQIGSDLVDVKLLNVALNKEWYAGFSHINFMAFARYFIPQFVVEDKVLYLDSDIVVTSSLDELFDLDVSEHYLAAVRSTFGYGAGFNSGMMVINNRRWREENLMEQFITLTEQEKDTIPEGDQTILNRLLNHDMIWLDDTYNFQVGFDYGAFTYRHRHLFDMKLDPLPAIIHYISPDKPWNTYSSGRLRDVWWSYHFIDGGGVIVDKWRASTSPILPIQSKGKIITLTNTHLLEQIEYLVEALPEYEFHIAAFTSFHDDIRRLAARENVFLHPHVIGYLLEEMIADCDLYLDINHGGKLDELLEHVMTNSKPVLSFDTTAAPIFNQYPLKKDILHTAPKEMVEAITQVMEQK